LSLDVRNTSSMVGNVGLTLMFTDVYKEQEGSFLWSIALRKREGISEHDSSFFKNLMHVVAPFVCYVLDIWLDVGPMCLIFNAGLTLAPLFVKVDPNLNVILTACLTVYVGCYRSVKPTPPSVSITSIIIYTFLLCISCSADPDCVCLKFFVFILAGNHV